MGENLGSLVSIAFLHLADCTRNLTRVSETSLIPSRSAQSPEGRPRGTAFPHLSIFFRPSGLAQSWHAFTLLLRVKDQGPTRVKKRKDGHEGHAGKEIGGAADPEARKFADTGVARAMITFSSCPCEGRGTGSHCDALLTPLLGLQVEACGRPSCLLFG